MHCMLSKNLGKWSLLSYILPLPGAGLKAEYINAVTDAFELEAVCLCRSTGKFSQLEYSGRLRTVRQASCITRAMRIWEGVFRSSPQALIWAAYCGMISAWDAIIYASVRRASCMRQGRSTQA